MFRNLLNFLNLFLTCLPCLVFSNLKSRILPQLSELIKLSDFLYILPGIRNSSDYNLCLQISNQPIQVNCGNVLSCWGVFSALKRIAPFTPINEKTLTKTFRFLNLELIKFLSCLYFLEKQQYPTSIFGFEYD